MLQLVNFVFELNAVILYNDIVTKIISGMNISPDTATNDDIGTYSNVQMTLTL